MMNDQHGAAAGGRKRALAILTLIYMFNFMDRQILGVLAEPIKQELSLSDGQLGLLNGFMFALFYSSFGVPIAWLADRARRTWVVASACVAWSGFSAACGLATSFLTLAAARVGVAVGEAGGVPPSYSLIADLFPSASRARALAVYSLGVPLGVGVGTAIGGWVAAAFGWRAAFLVVAAPGVLFALLLLIFVREPERRADDSAGGTGRGDHAPVSLPRAIALFAGSSPLMGVAISAGIGAFVCYGLMAWIAAYLIRVLGMTLHEVGSWLSITLAIGLAGGIWTSGMLADRLGPGDPRMYALIPGIALGIGMPVFLAATVIDDWRLALPLFGTALGLSIFYLAPSVAVVQQLVSADRRSTASALLLLCLNLVGLGCGPWLIGLVSDWAVPVHGTQSLRIAFYALTPMFGVALLANLASARLLGRSDAISAS